MLTVLTFHTRDTNIHHFPNLSGREKPLYANSYTHDEKQVCFQGKRSTERTVVIQAPPTLSWGNAPSYFQDVSNTKNPQLNPFTDLSTCKRLNVALNSPVQEVCS